VQNLVRVCCAAVRDVYFRQRFEWPAQVAFPVPLRLKQADQIAEVTAFEMANYLQKKRILGPLTQTR
jgi:hypothetical protein